MFIVHKNADGMNQCLVKIDGKDNSDRRSWPTPVLEKQEIAALDLENNEHIIKPDPRPADMSPPLINATSAAPGHASVIVTEKTTALISDRGIDAKLLMSTAYHPQANCMDERKHQTVEIAMRFRNLTRPESN